MKTDLLSFQFDKWGGGFIIEIGEGPSDELVQPWGSIPAGKLTTHLLPLANRARLNAVSRSEKEAWFRYDEDTQTAIDAATDQVLKLLAQADRWWQGERDLPNVRASA